MTLVVHRRSGLVWWRRRSASSVGDAFNNRSDVDAYHPSHGDVRSMKDCCGCRAAPRTSCPGVGSRAVLWYRRRCTSCVSARWGKCKD